LIEQAIGSGLVFRAARGRSCQNLVDTLQNSQQNRFNKTKVEDAENMSSVMYERMRVNPKFQKLVQERGRFAWTLGNHRAGPFLRVLHAGRFQPGAARDRRLPRDRCGRSATRSNFVLFVFFWLTDGGLRPSSANGEFDDLTAELIKEAQKEKL
jgi:uncharacterized membrane protein (DUF485 family)